MFSRSMTHGLLTLALAAGLAVAHAQESPIGDPVGRAPTIPLDLTLHVPQQTRLAAPVTGTGADSPVGLRGTATAPAGGSGELRLAPHVELLAGYDPYTVFDALDFKPRLGDYAVGLKLDF